MEILYSESQIAVCIKPVGLDSEHDVPAALAEQLGGAIFPLHRLDQNVGGVLVYARAKEAAARLSQVIQQGQMIKEYVACVHGMPPAQGDWQDLLFKDSRRNKVFVVSRPRNGVKEARLTFTRLTAGETSLVRIRLDGTDGGGDDGIGVGTECGIHGIGSFGNGVEIWYALPYKVGGENGKGSML